jgi:DNA polymerase III subunit delta'
MARRATRVTELPVPDASGPQPRTTTDLIGHDTAQATILDAWNQGRFHHGWMITGPRGVGKATLAFRLARFLLSNPEVASDGLFGATGPNSLDVSTEDPVMPLVASGAHPDLVVIERQVNDKGKLSAFIRIDDVRSLSGLMGMTRNDSWRVVIIDAAEDMNQNAANAVLKMLEEPPAKCCFILLSHVSNRVMPTIRSRCRRLDLKPLPDVALIDAIAAQGVAPTPAAVALAQGCPGRAVRLAAAGVDEVLQMIDDALAGKLDEQAAIKEAEAMVGRDSQPRYELFLELFPDRMARLLKRDSVPAPVDLEPAFALWDRAGMLSREAGRLAYDPQLVVNELLTIAQHFSKLIQVHA